MPVGRASGGMRPPIRYLLFWTLMILLAVVLWSRETRNPSPGSDAPVLAYSDFLAQVDAKNVQTADAAIFTGTVTITGKLKQPPSSYKTTVPRDSMTVLMDRLRQAGATVEVSEGNNSSTSFIVGILPIVLLVGFWIFMMRQQAKRAQAPPNQPTPGALG